MKPSDRYKLDEFNHVEKPLLQQIAELGWEIIDLTDEKQTPAHTFRESFTDVVMPKVLREQLKVINPWLADDQVEEVAKQLTASFSGTGLIERTINTYSICCWKIPASAKTATRASKARRCGLLIFTRTRSNTTGLSRSASSRCASAAPSIISFRTSFFL